MEEEEEKEEEAVGLRGHRAHGRIDDAITDGGQVEGREDAALYGVDDALRLLVQLKVREQRLNIGADARERPGEELDGVMLAEHEIDHVLNRRGRLRVVFLDLQHGCDVLLELGLGGEGGGGEGG